MIAKDKFTDALYALNAVLVQARTMSFERVTYETIVEVLDMAEVLPMLMARKEDTTEEFRRYLEDLVRIDEGFTYALQRFDGDHDLPR